MPRKKRWEYSDAVDGYLEVRLSSWKYFYDFVHQEFLRFTDYYWRGHGSYKWELESTLERILKKYPPEDRDRITKNHLERFQYSIRGRRGANPPHLKDDNEWWALGQHHGLSTPLLDWTASPFVSLYFAFFESSPLPKGMRAIYALHRYTAIEAGIEFVKPLTDDNPRIINQSGAFTRTPIDLNIVEAIKKHLKGVTKSGLIKILIPNKERHYCLTTLNRMNINYATLFPDISGSSLFCNHCLDIKNYSS